MIADGWHEHAACRGHDPELFFPEGDVRVAGAQVEKAKRVCRACPVANPCLIYALRRPEPHGVWGGTTPDERRVIRAASQELSHA